MGSRFESIRYVCLPCFLILFYMSSYFSALPHFILNNLLSNVASQTRKNEILTAPIQASADKQKPIEVGAELFIGNLDPMVDEKTLYDTFSRFGSLQSPPKIARDESGLSKGYGFVSYASFEASDDAIANMNGQYLMNKDVSVQYAYKKDGKGDIYCRALCTRCPTCSTVPSPTTKLKNGTRKVTEVQK